MKVIHIALKDMLQSFRSYIALAFMFGIPIMMTGIFYFLMGGMRGEDESIVLPVIPVVVVNLDQGSPGFDAATLGEMGAQQGVPGIDLSKVNSMGDILEQFLKGEALSDLLDVSTAQDAVSARLAVDRQEADVAIIIPAEFTAALVEPGKNASIEVYKDPTLTIGPGIVQSILSQFVDYSSATKVGINVIAQDLQEAGVVLDNAQFQQVAMQLVGAQTASGAGEGVEGYQQINVETVSGEKKAENNTFTQWISGIMSAMMIFFSFFTGAFNAQNMLTENEKGTLPRLFTTPTSHTTILGGKFLATFVTILIQVTILIVFANLVFRIHWGKPLPIIIFTLSLALVATAAGIFLISFVKTSRQAGIMTGGVLTLTGNLGMIGIFTMAAPNVSPVVASLPLLVPQGWAMRAVTNAREAGPPEEFLLSIGVLLVLALVFFLIGVTRTSKRYAT